MMRSNLDCFKRIIDKLTIEKCNLSIDEIQAFYSVNQLDAFLVKIILLRAIQASNDLGLTDVNLKSKARLESKKIFSYLSRQLSSSHLTDNERFRLALYLYYIKPESRDFANTIMQFSSSSKSYDLRPSEIDLIKYASIFAKYKPYGITPSDLYSKSRKHSINKKSYVIRISKLNRYSTVESSAKISRILVGCSTIDALAFHPCITYDYTVSIPGLLFTDITTSFINELMQIVALDQKINMDTTEIIPDFMIGFCNITSILNSSKEIEWDKESPNLLKDFATQAKESNFSIGLHQSFFGINQRLLSQPSVCGIIPRRQGLERDICYLRFLVSETSKLMQRSTSQEINFVNGDYICTRALIHEHEIHIKIDSHVAESVSLN